MKRADLIKALNRLKIETGSIVCLGCGHEHNCSTQGCALIRAAVEELKKMRWIPVTERMPELDPDDPESFRKCLITVPLTMERTGKSHWEVHTAYAKWHKNKRRKKPFVWFDDLPPIVTHWMLLPEPPEEA